jgi:aminopeptidase N
MMQKHLSGRSIRGTGDNQAMKRLSLLVALALSVAAPLASAEDAALNLPFGDPARREKTAALVLDGVTDTKTGEVITPGDLAPRLKDVRIVFVGESHTSAEFHRVQMRVLQELKRSGRRVLVGLEMYPYTEQSWLDQWGDGLLTEEGFVRLSRWYKNWGYNWRYYRDLFVFAKENGIRMFAVNTPREIVTAVRKKGFENLTEEEAAHIPKKVDTDNAEHRKLFRAFFGPEDAMHSGMSDEMWEGMFKAQCTWDATMGYNSVQALKKYGGSDAIMVVFIGAGHVAYGLGIERQAALWFDGRTATLIPVPVEGEKHEKAVVRASYANFLWGLPRETDALYPSLGLSTREGKDLDHLPIIAVDKEEPAAAAGLQVGDQLLTLDGTPVKDRETLNLLMAAKSWGDSARLEVRRADKTIPITVLLRRTLEEPKGVAPAKAK